MASSAIKSHGDIEQEARETYGKGELILRIGNGGAGATGLIAALATDYLSTLPRPASMQWVCNHSRNTQLALMHGYVDLALTYERDQEALAASEGWSVTIGCAFHDHFLLAGPISDPANVRSATSLTEAFLRIARSGALFHSRADGSATMSKERSIWMKSRWVPWVAQSDCYKTSLLGPAEALVDADAAGAYLLTDRSTFLRQTALRTIEKTTVFFEPESADDVLMNSCYLLKRPHYGPEREDAVTNFVDYVLSDRGQHVVATFGEKELGGFPLFAPVKDGFASSYLRCGMPMEGEWKAKL